MAVSWLVPPSSWGPEVQSWWGSGGAPRDGTGQSHAGWVPPTRVPSSPRPRPWATLAPARHSTAPPLPVQMPRHSTRAACHSQTCRPASQVGWAAQPCFWPLCPGGPGAVGSRSPPQNQALQLGKAATHRHASGTHTCFSPAALTETRQRDDPQAPPQTCYQVPGPAKFPRACTMYENTHPCVHAPLCACVRACMYILHCSSHRGLTHPLPSSLHILQPQHPQTEQRQTTWR